MTPRQPGQRRASRSRAAAAAVTGAGVATLGLLIWSAIAFVIGILASGTWQGDTGQQPRIPEAGPDVDLTVTLLALAIALITVTLISVSIRLIGGRPHQHAVPTLVALAAALAIIVVAGEASFVLALVHGSLSYAFTVAASVAVLGGWIVVAGRLLPGAS